MNMPPVDEIEELYTTAHQQIQQTYIAAQMARGEHCETVVMRNGMITDIEIGETEAERREAMFRLLARLAVADSKHVDELEGIIDHGTAAHSTLGKIRAFFGRVTEWQKDQVERLAAEIVSLKRQLEFATARTKAHAIHDENVRTQVWDVTGGKCFYCETDLVRGSEAMAGVTDRANVFHVDHLVPKSAGGPDHLTNYVPSCQTCNISKSDKPVAVFMASRRQPKLTLVASS